MEDDLSRLALGVYSNYLDLDLGFNKTTNNSITKNPPPTINPIYNLFSYHGTSESEGLGTGEAFGDGLGEGAGEGAGDGDGDEETTGANIVIQGIGKPS